jgi:aldehyde dehydrogenase (NAD+)
VEVIEGGVETSQNLLQRWDYIFFTGSVPVGKIVAQAAAVNLTPVTTWRENPCIVDETANLSHVARIIWENLLMQGKRRTKNAQKTPTTFLSR